MRTALIGYSGFVGNNLAQQHDFTELYNSKNIQEMKDKTYDLIVCAGVSAVKWMANKDPEEDYKKIKVLEDVLATVNTKSFILISTIDVYALTEGKDEEFDCSSLDNHAYGKHRRAFEKFCDNQFENCTIVRLPGLFGNGLKKNVIFDLLNDNCLEMINTQSSFQYYYLKHLWKDIQITIDNGVKLINFFTEPVLTQDICSTFFPEKVIGQAAVQKGHYDLYTKYASYWNRHGHYIYVKDEIMQQLAEFIHEYKKSEEK